MLDVGKGHVYLQNTLHTVMSMDPPPEKVIVVFDEGFTRRHAALIPKMDKVPAAGTVPKILKEGVPSSWFSRNGTASVRDAVRTTQLLSCLDATSAEDTLDTSLVLMHFAADVFAVRELPNYVAGERPWAVGFERRGL